ncbi:MAG: LysE family transporter [Bacteroidales bacterium]|jgi:threonine/homoserine/homoserine lactone efflux protein|nr:LysE family translocator [Bacteroidales bacterium]MBP5418576.1 LysE family transporter [Bacteroidales bacterium]MCR5697073.1 LysE family transporter [Marinilabiliaceae bacterium]
MEQLSLFINLFKGMCIGFTASVPLGPIGVLCIQRTLSKGRRYGFVSGVGAATSDFVYALVAGFSVSLVMEFVEAHQQILIVVGALVLLALGLKIFFTNPAKQMRMQRRKRNSGLWQNYISTFFLTITNPLAMFLFLGAFTLVGGERDIYTQFALILGVLLGASLWWLVLTMLVGIFRKKLTIRRLYYINKTAGAIIVALVVVALFMELFKVIFS